MWAFKYYCRILLSNIIIKIIQFKAKNEILLFKSPSVPLATSSKAGTVHCSRGIQIQLEASMSVNV
jgi:hypothetical protein